MQTNVLKFLNELCALRDVGYLESNICDLMDSHSITKSLPESSFEKAPFLNSVSGTGTIKFFIPANNYGFISPDESTMGDVFFRSHRIEPSLLFKLRKHMNVRVAFIAEETAKGLRATFVEEDYSDVPKNQVLGT